jgi:hypothetical protein
VSNSPAALRRILPIALILAAGYTGWVMYSRHQFEREAEERAAAREAERNRKIVDLYGGDKLTILSFAATAGVVRPGQRVGLCYGVSNAIRVKIEPGVEPLRPTLSHCTEAFPHKTTTYTLTAEDKAGKVASASLTVSVR